jgi:hypothetical protein
MAGNLYQLRYRQYFPNDSIIFIDGPYDKFGKVITLQSENKSGYLYLIRGCDKYGN